MNIAVFKDKSAGNEFVRDKNEEKHQMYEAALNYASTIGDVYDIVQESYNKILDAQKKV